jgi:CO/xanthine dehydrogenase FAD-binding subunit
LLLTEVGALLEGHAVDAGLAREAANAAARAVEPTDTLHASAAYQKHLTGVLVERALLRAWKDAA